MLAPATRGWRRWDITALLARTALRSEGMACTLAINVSLASAAPTTFVAAVGARLSHRPSEPLDRASSVSRSAAIGC